MSVLIAAFGLCWLAALWPYLGYPLLLAVLGPGRPRQSQGGIQPPIDVVMAAYNEAPVIEQKVRSVFACGYPPERLHLWVGLDACTDATAGILDRLIGEFPNLHVVNFRRRTGKPQIINQLVGRGQAPFLLGTDANVLFGAGMIDRLLAEMTDTAVAMVGGNIGYRGPQDAGVAGDERSYLGFENWLRHRESVLWNVVAGVEGGCYLMRRAAYRPVPPNVVVDDFYLTMTVLADGGQVRFAADALCSEDVSTRRWVEFHRKMRISRGNFYNLRAFSGLLVRRWWPLGFVVVSHKAMRWTAPLFLLASAALAVLLLEHGFFRIYLLLTALLALALAVDVILPERLRRPKLLKSLSHFLLMNLALVCGFFEFLRGNVATTWQPTQREQ